MDSGPWTIPGDLVHGLPLWTTSNFEDEFYQWSKQILGTLNGQNCGQLLL